MKLYVYDHCPYCVKARMIFGFKDLDFKLITLLNDDEDTPIAMIGQKMVPIFEKEDGSFMPESMDIVRYVDDHYGNKLLVGDERNAKLEKWFEDINEYMYKLTMPAWVEAEAGEYLEEFATESAKQYFIKRKQIYIGDFPEQRARAEEYKLEVNQLFKELNEIIENDGAVNGTLSEADIHLFAILRSLSIIKGLEYPEKLNSYRMYMSDYSGVLLHDAIAV